MGSLLVCCLSLDSTSPSPSATSSVSVFPDTCPVSFSLFVGFMMHIAQVYRAGAIRLCIVLIWLPNLPLVSKAAVQSFVGSSTSFCGHPHGKRLRWTERI